MRLLYDLPLLDWGEPDDGACTGVFVWSIEAGAIDGVDVAGRRAVSVSRHTGYREESGQEVVLFVDQDATPGLGVYQTGFWSVSAKSAFNRRRFAAEMAPVQKSSTVRIFCAGQEIDRVAPPACKFGDKRRIDFGAAAPARLPSGARAVSKTSVFDALRFARADWPFRAAEVSKLSRKNNVLYMGAGDAFRYDGGSLRKADQVCWGPGMAP